MNIFVSLFFKNSQHRKVCLDCFYSDKVLFSKGHSSFKPPLIKEIVCRIHARIKKQQTKFEITSLPFALSRLIKEVLKLTQTLNTSLIE